MKTKLFKFLIVGSVNTLFGYSLYALFIFCGLHYSIATLLSTIIGILFNFKTIGKFVFESRDNKLIHKFIAVYIFIYLLNVISLKIFVYYKTNLYLSGALLVLPLALISFYLNHQFVFTKGKNNEK